MSVSGSNETDSSEHSLSQKEIAELKRAFQAYVIKGQDEEDDDVILSKDLGNVLRSLGQNLSNMEIMDMINELGDEVNGKKITFEKFLQAISPKMREITIQEEIKEAFGVFDKDGNGTVSLNEFRSVLSVAVPNISEVELTEMLNDMDVNHDGCFEYSEFADLMGPVLDQH